MSDLKQQFEAAAAASKNLPERPDNNALLALYAHYKQATVGDASGDRPGMFDIAGRMKFDTWEGLKGMSSETASQKYIELVRGLGGKV